MRYSLLLFAFFFSIVAFAQPAPDNLLPVRGFSIAAPKPAQLDDFLKFIDKELGPQHINTLILRVEYNYQFERLPQLRDSIALSKTEVEKLVTLCRKWNIQVIPQINLLGHQSWASKPTNLLKVYPQFDETPYVKMPEKYVWPNADGLYCKSYCPLHPDVHDVVFKLVDEICDVFQATAFHAGMDEVFYLGDDKCPRCGGRDKAELFANEVRLISDHLRQSGRKLWIWGDRLIDGKTTGIGMWEGSYNNTYRAVDMIPRDVMICDWHYERADKTAVYFAMKGLQVVTCPWRNPELGVRQVNDMIQFRADATKEMRENYQGIVQTVWSDVGSFLDVYYGRKPVSSNPPPNFNPANTPASCFKAVAARLNNK